jgi:hypothetical protein
VEEKLPLPFFALKIPLKKMKQRGRNRGAEEVLFPLYFIKEKR